MRIPRRLLLAAALALLAAAPARARLWETYAECEARYSPNPASPSRYGARQRGEFLEVWTKGDLKVWAVFYAGRCEQISFQPPLGQRLPPGMVPELLAKNAAGGKWVKRGGETVLVRDGKAVAFARMTTGAITLGLELTTAGRLARLKAKAGQRAAQERAALRGF